MAEPGAAAWTCSCCGVENNDIRRLCRSCGHTPVADERPGKAATPTSLRERCGAIVAKLQRDAILRQGNPVDTLLEFVIAEQGRTADHALDKTLPLCLYFATDEDREEFIAAVRAAKPNMVAKKLP